MSSIDVNNLRKAALALHALAPHDLQRVWSRLDAGQHEALGPLLEELSSLGIPKGRKWLDPDEDDAAQQSALIDEVRRCRAVVWGVRAEQVLPVLTAQSLDTAVTVMRIAKWPWLDDAVEAWPPEQRHTVRQRLEQAATVPDKLADHLLQSMAQALLASTGSHAMPASRRRHRPWYHGLKSLFLLS